ncbi:hypothetical protein BKA80DRAFT_113033 [Phyllosticta citrichinensis]
MHAAINHCPPPYCYPPSTVGSAPRPDGINTTLATHDVRYLTHLLHDTSTRCLLQLNLHYTTPFEWLPDADAAARLHAVIPTMRSAGAHHYHLISGYHCGGGGGGGVCIYYLHSATFSSRPRMLSVCCLPTHHVAVSRLPGRTAQHQVPFFSGTTRSGTTAKRDDVPSVNRFSLKRDLSVHIPPSLQHRNFPCKAQPS